MQSAKVFTSGNSQAIRLPKEFQFKETELFIQKNRELNNPLSEG